jgi:hypothetical protein
VSLTPSLLIASVSPCYVSKSVANPPSHKRNHTASREASHRNAAAILALARLPLSEEALYAGAACMAGRNLPVRHLGRCAGGSGSDLLDVRLLDALPSLTERRGSSLSSFQATASERMDFPTVASPLG